LDQDDVALLGLRRLGKGSIRGRMFDIMIGSIGIRGGLIGDRHLCSRQDQVDEWVPHERHAGPRRVVRRARPDQQRERAETERQEQ
jgi:hypothetical protein